MRGYPQKLTERHLTWNNISHILKRYFAKYNSVVEKIQGNPRLDSRPPVLEISKFFSAVSETFPVIMSRLTLFST